ncbi:MAG: hypothetical protein QXF56_02755 [Candidatus Micrarchaeia archaeon]
MQGLRKSSAKDEAMVFGISLKKEPHSLEENRTLLVGRKEDEEGVKETKISLKHDKMINWQLKMSGKERKWGGFKEDILVKFNADFNLDAKLVKIRSECIGEYAAYTNKENLEDELRRVIQSRIGKQWLVEELENLGKRRFVAKPLG